MSAENKVQPIHYITFSVEKELKVKFQELVNQDERSMSWALRMMMKKAVDQGEL
jgi:hypothetical protein